MLGRSPELSDSFKGHYGLWLEQEVFGPPIEWDKLLLIPHKDEKPKSEDDDDN